MPEYEEKISDDEDQDDKTRRLLMTDAYEDNAALVGHPGQSWNRGSKCLFIGFQGLV